MLDITRLVQLIKKAAVDAVEASDPTDLYIGVVVSEAPLEIQLDQKLILTAEFLILTQNVTDYDIYYTPEDENKKKMTIHSALKQGNIVLLAMTKGGQNYIVLDRIVT